VKFEDPSGTTSGEGHVRAFRMTMEVTGSLLR
jgi:hypothetical protein